MAWAMVEKKIQQLNITIAFFSKSHSANGQKTP